MLILLSAKCLRFVGFCYTFKHFIQVDLVWGLYFGEAGLKFMCFISACEKYIF